MCTCGQGPFTEEELAAHVARMRRYARNADPAGRVIAGTNPRGPHGPADSSEES